MNIQAPDTTVGQLTLTDKMYSAEMLSVLFDAKQVKLVVPGGGTRWVLSTESTGEAMEAFMADADSYTVTESYNGYWNYSLTGYDESAYTAPVMAASEKKDVALFPISSASSGEALGIVTATLTAVDAGVPAQVDTTPTNDSVKLATSGGIWSAIWGSLKSLPTGFTSLYDWCKNQLSGKLNRTEAIEGFTEWEAISFPAGYVLDRCIYKGNSLWEVYLSIPDPGPGPVPVPPVYLVQADQYATTLSSASGDVQLTRTKIRPTKTSDLANDGDGVRPFALSAGHGHTGNLAALDANGNPVDSGMSLDVMTQAQYDGLSEYDENTIYVIVNS